MIHCPVCQREYDDLTRFCSIDGAALHPAGSPPSGGFQNPQSQNVPPAVQPPFQGQCVPGFGVQGGSPHPGGQHMAYTSDLTGQEFWLVMDKGYIPVGLVLGNSVYSMGAIGGWLSGFKGQFKGEVVEVTQLMYSARELALQRMQQEATRLGADFVVGVTMKIEYLHGGNWMEVTAIGTAVKFGGTREPSKAQVVVNT